tara:strand:- start:13 stop:135 length:123 start_codon:yes stop_codon:yes gene_type:complete
MWFENCVDIRVMTEREDLVELVLTRCEGKIGLENARKGYV